MTEPVEDVEMSSFSYPTDALWDLNLVNEMTTARYSLTGTICLGKKPVKWFLGVKLLISWSILLKTKIGQIKPLSKV